MRITAKANSMAEADRMIAEMEALVRERIREGLFGVDQETLEETLLVALRDKGWIAALVECGLGGALRGAHGAGALPRLKRADRLRTLRAGCAAPDAYPIPQECGCGAGLGISLEHTCRRKHILHIVCCYPGWDSEQTRFYGGERALGRSLGGQHRVGNAPPPGNEWQGINIR